MGSGPCGSRFSYATENAYNKAYNYDNVSSVVLVSSSAVEVKVDNRNNNCSRL